MEGQRHSASTPARNDIAQAASPPDHHPSTASPTPIAATTAAARRIVGPAGQLSVCVFGSSVIRIDGRPRPLGISGTTRDLLHYLVINVDRDIRREYLAEIFWDRSSYSRQRSALNSALWRINRQLEELPGLTLCGEDGSVRLEIATGVPIDARELTVAVQSACAPGPMSQDTAERLCRALDASDAPFLNGAVETWALAERERLWNLRLRGLTILMRLYAEQRRYEDALEVGRRLIAADPFREVAQCELMWIYVLNGQRAQALVQYRSYAKLLEAELDIEPMPETRALYEHILQDLDCGVRRHNRSPPRSAGDPRRCEPLSVTFCSIERARRELYRSLREQLR